MSLVPSKFIFTQELLIPGRKPVGPVEVDRQHRHLRGCIGRFLIRGTRVIDLLHTSIRAVATGDPIGRNFELNGTDEYCEIPYHSAYDFTGGYTIMLRMMRVTDTGSTERVFTNKDSAGTGYVNFLQIHQDKFHGGHDASVIHSATVVPTGQYMWVGISWNGATIYIHVDGVEEISGSYTDAPNASTGALQVGRLFAGGTAYYAANIRVSDLLIFNRALSPAEQKAIIRNPYADLQPPGPEYLTFSTGAAPPATSIPLMYHHYQMAGGL